MFVVLLEPAELHLNQSTMAHNEAFRTPKEFDIVMKGKSLSAWSFKHLVNLIQYTIIITLKGNI